MRQLSFLWRACIFIVVGAIVIVGDAVVAPVAFAGTPLVGQAATDYARDDADAQAPAGVCDVTVTTREEIASELSAAGSARTICIGAAFDSGDTSQLVELIAERDVILDLNGMTTSIKGVHLSVADGHHLQIADRRDGSGTFVSLDGLRVGPSSSLVIWSGRVLGVLKKEGFVGNAGIGGAAGESSGEIVIRGGVVDADGGRFSDNVAGGAGLGGGRSGSAGPVTIWGGEVIAQTSGNAGIGGGDGGSGGRVVIHGGNVRAISGSSVGCLGCLFTYSAAGIGGGGNAGGGDVLITGGTVYAEAEGFFGGAGIGSANCPSSAVSAGTVTITGGDVTAKSSFGAAIGGGLSCDKGAIVKITGGNVTVSSNTGKGPIGNGNGGGDVSSGSLEIGKDASVTILSKPTIYALPHPPLAFGDAPYTKLVIDGTVTVVEGLVLLSPPGSNGDILHVGPNGVLTVPGDNGVRGVGPGKSVVENLGTIIADVDLDTVDVTGNNFFITFRGPGTSAPANPMLVFAPSLAAAGTTLPTATGVVSWSGRVTGQPATSETMLASESTSPPSGHTRLVAFSAMHGSTRVVLPSSVDVGGSVTADFQRLDDDGDVLPVDQSASYSVTDSAGNPVDSVVIAGNSLTFASPGDYLVHGTSTAPGYEQLTAVAAIQVQLEPTLTGQVPPAAISGVAYSFPLEAAGYPAPVLTVTGELPPGLTLVNGAITGTPNSAGEFEATVTASNAAGSVDVEVAIQVAVGAPVALRLALAEDSEVRQGESAALTVTATDAYGQSYDATELVHLSSAGLEEISGMTVTFPEAGAQLITATLIDDPTVSATVQVEVLLTPALTGELPPAAISGVAYSFALEATGYPAPVLTIAGELPPGLTLEDGVIAGSPTRAGDYEVTITATSAAGVADVDYTLRVAVGAPVTVTLALPEGANVRQRGSVTLEATATDALGQSYDAAGLVQLSSSVGTDVISGMTVTFPHASPHVITATVIADPTVSASILVEVTSVALTSTGLDAAPLATALGGGILLLLAGLLTLVLRRVSQRRR